MTLSFSYSEENYLKTIYHLQLRTSKVTTNAVARSLQMSPASVTDMMKKLHAKKLLHYKPYYGFSLSAEGKKMALYVVRRHRLWESFLAEKLAFGWDEVHEIAEELEHIRNKKLIDKLDAFLGFPQFDPHGDPIPDGKGKLQQQELKALTEMAVPAAVIIKMVTNQSKEMLEELAARQMHIGTKIALLARSKFDGSLTIKISKKETVISEQLGSNILVKKQ